MKQLRNKWVRFTAVLLAVSAVLLCSCGGGKRPEGLGNGWQPSGYMDTLYATQFSVEYYEGGYKLVTLGDGTRYLTVPPEKQVPDGIANDIILLYQPIDHIYLAATAAMCLFDELDRLDAITLSGTREDGWYVDNARIAMQQGRIIYAGKYSEPDYELLIKEGCPVAIESMMIGHASDVKKKLEELGIAVFVDRSSLEEHPLGRTEWIRLYGALLDEEEKADKIFQRQISYLRDVEGKGSTEKTVAFFHINSAGLAVVRKSGDYVSKMIELAGGKYIFRDIGDPELMTSTVSVEMEAFFAAAKDADFLIYNCTIGDEIRTLDELLDINKNLSVFRAVQNGNVWCTRKNMYQESTQFGQMIQSFHKVFSGEADDLDELPYLYRLR